MQVYTMTAAQALCQMADARKQQAITAETLARCTEVPQDEFIRRVAVVHADVVRRSLGLNSSITTFATEAEAVEALTDWKGRLATRDWRPPINCSLGIWKADDDLFCIVIRWHIGSTPRVLTII